MRNPVGTIVGKHGTLACKSWLLWVAAHHHFRVTLEPHQGIGVL